MPHSLRTRVKINLTLAITGRRDDGYHELESLVAFLDVGDRLTCEETSEEGCRLTVTGPFAAQVPSDETNLVYRAAALLSESTRSAWLHLEKYVPPASGLGGGSGDAAAAIHLLNERWGLGLSEAEKANAGLRLGADVPACLLGRACFMRGIGELLEPFYPLPPVFALLANPGVVCNTQAIFQQYRDAGDGFSSNAGTPDTFYDTSEMTSYLKNHGNDLQAAAVSLHPEIASLLRALETLENARLVRMSGSGATCFALFDTAEALWDAQEKLEAGHPDWWTASGRLR